MGPISDGVFLMDAFECKQCGICCEGKGGIIVSPSDLTRLARYLHMAAEEVIARFGEYHGTKLTLKNGADGFCIFYHKESGCSVHEGKPAVCQAWPFFRGNLIDKESYLLAKQFCPGINPDLSHEDFVSAGLAYLKAHNLPAQDAHCEANALILS